MQIYIAEFGNDQVEDVRLAHLLNFRLELEIIEDRADVCRKSLDVANKVLLNVVRIALEFLECQRRMIVETLSRRLIQHFVESFVLVPVFHLLVFAKHRCLAGR